MQRTIGLTLTSTEKDLFYGKLIGSIFDLTPREIDLLVACWQIDLPLLNRVFREQLRTAAHVSSIAVLNTYIKSLTDKKVFSRDSSGYTYHPLCKPLPEEVNLLQIHVKAKEPAN